MTLAPVHRRPRVLRRVLAVAGVAALAVAGVVQPATAVDIPPIVGHVWPGVVPSDRDQRIQVWGAGLDGATSVTFGGVPGTGLVETNGNVSVDVPRHPAGIVDVVVTTPGGTSNAVPIEFVDTHAGVVSRVPLRIENASVYTYDRPTCLLVVGTNGVPAGASGVLLNVTVHGKGAGHVAVYPDPGVDVPGPAISTVNFEADREVANAAFVATGNDGSICYQVRGANAWVIIDVTGFVMGDAGMELQTPVRLLDTRSGSGPVPSGTVQTVQVRGQAGVPDDAAAVILNATVTGTAGLGNLRLFPAGTPVPTASTVNYAPGKDKANLAIVPLSSSGKISFVSDAGGSTAHVILDVAGYVTAGGAYRGATPTRVLDTRPGSGHVGAVVGPLQARTPYTIEVPSALVPAGATSVALNVTAIGPNAYGNLRVYPSGSATVPDASTINYILGRDIPNLVVVDLPDTGPATVTLYSDVGPGGTVHVAADVTGFVVAP